MLIAGTQILGANQSIVVVANKSKREQTSHFYQFVCFAVSF